MGQFVRKSRYKRMIKLLLVSLLVGLSTACIPGNSNRPNGAICSQNNECTSGKCCGVVSPFVKRCAQCCEDSDCQSGQFCWKSTLKAGQCKLNGSTSNYSKLCQVGPFLQIKKCYPPDTTTTTTTTTTT